MIEERQGTESQLFIKRSPKITSMAEIRLFDGDDIGNPMVEGSPRPIEDVISDIKAMRYGYGCESAAFVSFGACVYPDLTKAIAACTENSMGSIAYVERDVVDWIPAAARAGLGEIVLKIYGSELQHTVMEAAALLNMAFSVTIWIDRHNLNFVKPLVSEAIKMGVNRIRLLPWEPRAIWAQDDVYENQARISEVAAMVHEVIASNSGFSRFEIARLPMCLVRDSDKRFYVGYIQGPYSHQSPDYVAMNRLSPDKVIEYLPNAVGAWRTHILAATGDPKELLWNYMAYQVREGSGHVLPKEKCAECACRMVCDGIHSQYQLKFGIKELKTLDKGRLVMHPLYYKRSEERA